MSAPTAQAAARYINDYRRGINGHPADARRLRRPADPVGASDCGNQLLTDKVPAVIYSVSGRGGPLFRVLSGARTPPHRLRIERHEIELAKTGSLGLANGLVVTFAGPAKIAQLAGAKWAAKIVTDVPAAPGPAKAVSPASYSNAGLTVDILTIPSATADLTPHGPGRAGQQPRPDPHDRRRQPVHRGAQGNQDRRRHQAGHHHPTVHHRDVSGWHPGAAPGSS